MTTAQSVPSDLIEIGQLRAPYGIQGWLWVYSQTDPHPNLFDYQPWWIQTAQGWQTLTVKRWRTQGKGLVVRLAEVEDRNDADRMSGTTLWISKAQLPPAGIDEYYWSDLIGLTVYGVGEHEQDERPILGVVSELFETGANDILVVQPSANSVDNQERFIPWHTQTVQHVDLEQKRIDVDWGIDY